MAYAAVLSLQSAFKNLVFSPRISVSPLSRQSIENALEELDSLREVLKRLDATSKGSSRKNVNALDAEIKEAVWQFEDLVESHLYHQLLSQSDSDQILHLEVVESHLYHQLLPQSDSDQILHLEVVESHLYHQLLPESDSDRILHLEVSLQELSLDIDRFIEMLDGKEEEYITQLDNLNMFPEEDEAAPQTAADSGEGRKSKRVGPSSDMLFESIRTTLDSPARVNVVRVIGMAGIGKTALARGFFDDPLIFSELEFDCRAWVTLGRKPDELGAIKRDILTQLDPASRDRKIKKRDVQRLLKGIFNANRCMVVLDDAWDTQVLDELKSLFPDYGGGKTLVLLTTRLHHVGDKIDERWSQMSCQLMLLDEDQSWDLLRQSVLFDGEEGECPVEFIKSGKKIAQKCDGLPLMILAVAALLSEAEMTAEFWEEVAEKAYHPIFMEAYDQLYEVLLPSYEYLPQHLKPCFLHMGVFPQYSEIFRDKLLCLWITEGFLENHFNRYVKGLNDHSIVMLCRTSSVSYNIKSFRLHSTFWHLCRREATNTKFCRVLTIRDDGLQQLTIKGQRRLSFHNNILLAMRDVVDSVEEACASSARSLFCYGPYHPYPVPVCFGLRLLKVLDAFALRFYEFPEQVMQLVYLTYLALTCNTALPPRISRLWNLQFLFIHRNQSIKLSRVTPYVPVEIWDMKQLQHIEIKGRNLPNPPPRDSNGVEDEDGASSSSLERLGELIGVGAETCTREVLERIPNLSKLGILIESSPDVDEMEQVLDHLSNIHLLTKLFSLSCVVSNPIIPARKGVVAPVSMFPSSLRKLCLSGLGYPWECMSVIGSLPNLQVLKLRCYAFRGPEWVVRYGEFRALKYLLIEGTDLVHFEVEDGGSFRLRTFSLQNCYKLKHLLWEPDLSYPVSYGVFDCSPAAATFAREMRSRCESHPQNQHQVYVESSWE